MKLEVFGLTIRAYKWHSINPIPHGGVHDVCADDKPFRIIGRAYWATVLGYVIDVTVPTSREGRRAWDFTPAIGPFWSRRKRQWYWAHGKAVENA